MYFYPNPFIQAVTLLVHLINDTPDDRLVHVYSWSRGGLFVQQLPHTSMRAGGGRSVYALPNTPITPETKVFIRVQDSTEDIPDRECLFTTDPGATVTVSTVIRSGNCE